VVLEAGSDAVELDLMLPAGFEVSGRALAPDGKPLAGARIDFSPYEEPYGSTVWSRADGSFSASLQSGEYCIRTSRQGYIGAEWQPLVVAGADVSGLDVRLRPRVLLRGRIRGQEQEPWEQVRIRASSNDGPENYGEVDPEGKYRIEVGPGAWEIVAWIYDPLRTDPYRTAMGRVVVPPGATEARLDLQLQPGPMESEQEGPEGPCRRPLYVD
jgi:hypothetical protein